MIPDLPEGMSEQEILKFYDTLSGNLTDQSTIHVHWWTHRQNPSVCWICDIGVLLSKILDIAQRKYTKSPVDIGTYESLEKDSDSEIETNTDEDENYNEPEYEVIEEDES
jgi:hypothetical protein